MSLFANFKHSLNLFVGYLLLIKIITKKKNNDNKKHLKENFILNETKIKCTYDMNINGDCYSLKTTLMVGFQIFAFQ